VRGFCLRDAARRVPGAQATKPFSRVQVDDAADAVRQLLHRRRGGASVERDSDDEDTAHVSMTALSGFGLFAVTAMLVCYALEDRSRWFVLAFAVACLLGSVYGFLQGAWPFGLVEAIWCLVALGRWWRERQAH
jgi:hypothetical protein